MKSGLVKNDNTNVENYMIQLGKNVGRCSEVTGGSQSP